MTRRPGAGGTPAPAPALPRLILARDHPPAQVRREVASGRWLRVQRGAYLEVGDGTTDPRRTGLAQIAAARARLTADHVVSHESAALLWGLPLLRPARAVHVTQGWSASSTSSAAVVRHVVTLSEREVVVRAGMRVTTLERTAVDVALTSTPAAGLVVVDAALHRGADPVLCAQMLDSRPHTPGIRRARAVLAAADDGAESPGETVARLAVLRLGIARPQTQVRVQTLLGDFWADLGWPEHRVLGEYDGVAKYAGTGDAVDQVLREKRRQEAMEEAGWRVLRMTREDLHRPSLLHQRLRAVLPPDALTHPVDPHLR